MTTPSNNNNATELLNDILIEQQRANNLLENIVQLLQARPAPAAAAPRTAAAPAQQQQANGEAAPPTVGSTPWYSTKSGNGWTCVLPDLVDVEGNKIRLLANLNQHGYGATAFAGDGQMPSIGWHNGATADEAVNSLLAALYPEPASDQTGDSYQPGDNYAPTEYEDDVDALPF